ncbi:hypothetical protein JCM19302_2304 [Jejuia pallidilutea]|uniref:Uncharacterized protein n=1 Tax=Jejuia pallidilutea TaxID=504487 RepID=A0A090W833_9FLAO|nr:hypothetical protein JCM19302_2304 [Jejuia pallidilutea]
MVIGETQLETKPVFDVTAKTNASKIVYADKLVNKIYKSDMIGSYQIKNIKTAYQTIKMLQTKGYTISDENITQAF